MEFLLEFRFSYWSLGDNQPGCDDSPTGIRHQPVEMDMVNSLFLCSFF
jgi:hypothetical protein